MMRKWITLVLVCGLANLATAEPDYQEEIENWHQTRLERLTRPDGWLTLVGLHWLSREEKHFPGIGWAHLEGETVHLRPESGKEIAISPKQGESEPALKRDSVTTFVIRRGSRVALRVKDSEAPLRLNFPGIDRFSVDPKWRLQARFEAAQEELSVDSVVGVATRESSPGWAHFRWEGEQYRVRLLPGSKPGQYFLVFRDATSGRSTYGACRFVYLETEDGELVLDFNRAFNPPCAFTPYATCPLPFKENRLPFAIEAGEKTFAH